MYWWFVYFTFWNSVLGAARTSLLVLVEFDASFWSHWFHESELWAFSCRLTWERSISGLWVVYSYDHLVHYRHSPDWREIQNSAEDFPSRSTGCVKPCWLVSPSLEPLVLASQSMNLQGKSFLDLSLTWRSACRSDHRVKLMKWLQENIEKLIILNNRSNVSEVVLGVNMCDLDLGSKLILSNNQSSWSLWVLDTCPIVGLLPLIIILITASLSSKMYNWDSPWEECVLVGTWSTSLNWSTFCFLVTCWVLVLESRTDPVSWWLVCSGWLSSLV